MDDFLPLRFSTFFLGFLLVFAPSTSIAAAQRQSTGPQTFLRSAELTVNLLNSLLGLLCGLCMKVLAMYLQTISWEKKHTVLHHDLLHRLGLGRERL